MATLVLSPSLPLRGPIPLNSGPKVDDGYHFLSSNATDRRITFHHPGYPPSDDRLFSLYAWDSTSTRGGLHYGLAHNACAIIADNRHDGYLSTTRGGVGQRVTIGDDEVLPAGHYWFFVPRQETPSGSANEEDIDCTPYQWPVVASFQDWVFPIKLPSVWSRIKPSPQDNPPQHNAPQSLASAATRARDNTCRITNHATGTQCAHLCPEHEREWFISNGMDDWNRDTMLDTENLLNDLGNTILLRSDLHTAFDQQQFTFFPKDPQGMAIHMLKETNDIRQLYHNARLYPIHGCTIQFLYARFAWSIFPSIARFLCHDKRKVIRTRVEDGIKTRVPEELSVRTLRGKATTSRSNNPRKRSNTAAFGAQENDSNNGLRFANLSSQRHRVTSNQSFSSQGDLSTTASLRSVDSKPSTPFDHGKEQEDLRLQDIFDEATRTGINESLLPPSKYPGWREIDELREQALAKQRPYGFDNSNLSRSSVPTLATRATPKTRSVEGLQQLSEDHEISHDTDLVKRPRSPHL